MSKSVGNTVDPLKVMETNGADIIRLWALSVDYTEDHRIGDEILKGVADQYRKLRNTFRYMLGALDGFGGTGTVPSGTVPNPSATDGTVPEGTVPEVVPYEDMPELERYVLHLLADLDAKLKVAVNDYDFNSYTRLLSDFANNDLSAFFFDIRKDCLYCDVGANAPLGSPKRMAYRTVLDILFHAMVRYATPVLVFTAEEVWGTRFPDAGSVHLLEWPSMPQITGDHAKWEKIRFIRDQVNVELEHIRRSKEIRSSMEAVVVLGFEPGYEDVSNVDWAELLIVSTVYSGVVGSTEAAKFLNGPVNMKFRDGVRIGVASTTNHKCGRCWRHLPEVTEDGALCGRCDTVLSA